MEVEALRLKFQVGPSAEVGGAVGGEGGEAMVCHARARGQKLAVHIFIHTRARTHSQPNK